MQEAENNTRTPARTFQDLLVWQKGHQFVLEVYRLTESFPRTETYGLTSQLRRAAVQLSLSSSAQSAKSVDRKIDPQIAQITQI